MTPSYEHIAKLIQEHAERRHRTCLNNMVEQQKRLERDLHDMNETTKREQLALSKVTLTYLSTGLAIDHDLPYMTCSPHRYGWGASTFSWKQYFRGLAKETKRPFVYARKGTHYDWVQPPGESRYAPYWHLRMPALKRLAPLYSALLLYDPEVCERNTGYTTLHEFTFKGNLGVEAFNEWRKFVTTDLVCRKLLGVI